MDSWFTQQPLIKELTDQGLDVIGTVKKLRQRYLINGERVEPRSIVSFGYANQREKWHFAFYSYNIGQRHSSQDHIFCT